MFLGLASEGPETAKELLGVDRKRHEEKASSGCSDAEEALLEDWGGGVMKGLKDAEAGEEQGKERAAEADVEGQGEGEHSAINKVDDKRCAPLSGFATQREHEGLDRPGLMGAC